MLGIPKTIPSLLSGEMRDTAFLGELEGMLGGLLETAVGRLIGTQIKEVCDTFRTWGALWAMLPRGGEAVWGDADAGAPESAALNFFLQMRDAGASRETGVNHTVDGAMRFLFDYLAESAPHNVAEFSAFLDDASRARLKTRVPDVEAKTAPNFGDPLRSPLPRAPNMKIFCLYGAGKPSERAYVYERFAADALRPHQLDVQSRDGALTHGVWQVDGDGSIPLISLGYVCREWRVNRDLNPANVSVVTREYAHRALPLAVGGLQGTSEGDHVNIMGNEAMIRDVLTVVAGRASPVDARVVSDVDALAATVRARRASRATTAPYSL
jgi:phospholipid:diacylglycerol acyltransferase